jgi:hypothetical protein
MDHLGLANAKKLLQKYLQDDSVKYVIISKIECPCCCIVKNLLTSKNYLNLPEDKVIIIYDNSDKELLSYIRGNDGILNDELMDIILVNNNETIADTYPCVFVKEGDKFKYLEGGKDGMIRRFVLTLNVEYPELYERLLQNIKVKLENPSESNDIFCRCTENELKPNDSELKKHIKYLNNLRDSETPLSVT